MDIAPFLAAIRGCHEPRVAGAFEAFLLAYLSQPRDQRRATRPKQCVSSAPWRQHRAQASTASSEWDYFPR